MPANPYQTNQYQDFASAYRPTVQPNAGTRTIGGSQYNPYGGYTYTQGMRGSDFVKQNVKQDLNPAFSNGLPNQNFTLGVASLGISQIPRAISGYRAYKKKQGEDRRREAAWGEMVKERTAAVPTEYLGTIDPTSQTFQQARQRMGQGVEKYMGIPELQQAYQQEQEANQRGQYEQAINAYFSDPARSGWQQQVVQDRLNNDLAQVSDQYGQDLQRSVQSSAARGMRGGSVDVEGRGDVARVRDTRAIGAAADADAQRFAFQNRDQQERSNLLGMVNQRGITDGQQLSQALQGIHTQTAAEGAQYASGQRQNEINRFGQQAQSQAWGQGLTGIANSVNRRYGTQGTTQGGW